MTHYVGDSCPGGHRGTTVKTEMFENFEAQTGEVHCKGCGAVYPVVYHTSNCPNIGLDKRQWGEVPLRRPDWSKILPGIKPTEEPMDIEDIYGPHEEKRLAAHKSEGKPLVGDIDPELELAIGHILAASVGKYPNDADGMPNWWKGGSYRGFAASIKRHLAAWLSGEEWDKESRMPHLWHAATDLMFLLSWNNRHVGQDDRLKEASLTGISNEPIKHRVARPVAVDRTVPPQGD